MNNTKTSLESLFRNIAQLHSELPIDAYVGLPFFMPIAAKGAFRLGIEIGTVVDAECTAEAGFVPGTAVVVGQVHRFSVGRGQVEAAVTAEFVEDRGFQVIVIGLGRIRTTLSEDEARRPMALS